MTAGLLITHRLLSPDTAWDSVRRDAAAQSPEEAFLTLRTFGLEGVVTMQFGLGVLRWYGSVLELASGFAEWLRQPNRRHLVRPAGQSDDMEIVPDKGTATFRNVGGPEVELPLDQAVLVVEEWLVRLSGDIRSNAAQVLALPGFEWARDRAGCSPAGP